MNHKIKKILSMVLIGIMVGAIPAVAVTGTTNWNNNQGADSVVMCKLGETPYLFWVFTKDSYKLGSVMLTLEVNGDIVSTGDMEKQANGAYHLKTEFYDLGTLEAHVDYNVIRPGNGQLNLVISHGCTGGEAQIPEFPTVALPIAAVIGLVFFFQQRNTKRR